MNLVSSADKGYRRRPRGLHARPSRNQRRLTIPMTSASFRLFLAGLSAAAALYPGFAAETPPVVLAAPQVLSLQDCLRLAMENNRRRPASRFAVAMAEAQHRQALAGYWPQVTAKAGYFRLDGAPNFIFPASTMVVPAQTVTVPAGTAMVTIPAEAFAPGFPPAPIQMPVAFPGQSITTAAQVFPIPQQNVKLLNPDNFTVSGNLTWLLWDGGMRKGYREQAGEIPGYRKVVRIEEFD